MEESLTPQLGLLRLFVPQADSEQLDHLQQAATGVVQISSLCLDQHLGGLQDWLVCVLSAK